MSERAAEILLAELDAIVRWHVRYNPERLGSWKHIRNLLLGDKYNGPVLDRQKDAIIDLYLKHFSRVTVKNTQGIADVRTEDFSTSYKLRLALHIKQIVQHEDWPASWTEVQCVLRQRTHELHDLKEHRSFIVDRFLKHYSISVPASPPPSLASSQSIDTVSDLAEDRDQLISALPFEESSNSEQGQIDFEETQDFEEGRKTKESQSHNQESFVWVVVEAPGVNYLPPGPEPLSLSASDCGDKSPWIYKANLQHIQGATPHDDKVLLNYTPVGQPDAKRVQASFDIIASDPPPGRPFGDLAIPNVRQLVAGGRTAMEPSSLALGSLRLWSLLSANARVTLTGFGAVLVIAIVGIPRIPLRLKPFLS